MINPRQALYDGLLAGMPDTTQTPFVIGVGVGVGVGLLIAPASGEKARTDIANKVSDLSEKVRDRGRKPQGATGTYGE